MARTYQGRHIRPSITGKRPSIPHNPAVDLGSITATILDEESMILVPSNYDSDEEWGDPDEPFSTLWDLTKAEMDRCHQATAAYERIEGEHPNCLRFLRRDPWTAFPIISKPPGQPLVHFIRERESVFYSNPLGTSSTRILPAYRPLIYEWALNLISALCFVHSQNIVFGLLTQGNCWVSTERKLHGPGSDSPHPQLSIFGFADARFNNKPSDIRPYHYPGDWMDSPYHVEDFNNAPTVSLPRFYPTRKEYPTKQTDLYLYGCILFELMVGVEEHTPFQWQIAKKITDREWPDIETVLMGEIVRKCWKAEFASAEEVKGEVEAFVSMYGG